MKRAIILILLLLALALAGCAKEVPPYEMVDGEKIYNDPEETTRTKINRSVNNAAEGVKSFLSEYGWPIIEGVTDVILFTDPPDIDPSVLQ